MPANKKPKAKKPKGPPPTKDPAQSAIFLKIAKGLEVDESGKSFGRAMEAIMGTPRKR
jgi:hypothetical protein